MDEAELDALAEQIRDLDAKSFEKVLMKVRNVRNAEKKSIFQRACIGVIGG